MSGDVRNHIKIENKGKNKSVYRPPCPFVIRPYNYRDTGLTVYTINMANINTEDESLQSEIKDEIGVDFTTFTILRDHSYSVTIGDFTTFTVLREHSYSKGINNHLNSSIKIEPEWDTIDTTSNEHVLDHE